MIAFVILFVIVLVSSMFRPRYFGFFRPRHHHMHFGFGRPPMMGHRPPRPMHMGPRPMRRW